MQHLLRCGDASKRMAWARPDHRLAPSQLRIGGRRIVRRNDRERAAFIEVQGAKICAANARRIGQYGLKHRIEIARRARNNAQHLRGGGLLLQRLGEVGGALAQFCQKPRILDGDHCLVGEGGHQPDLLFGERFHRGAQQANDTDRHTVAQQRDPEQRALPSEAGGFMLRVFGVGQAIRDMDRAAFEGDSANQRSTVHADRMFREVFDPFRIGIVRPRHMVLSIPQPEQDGIFRRT